MSQGENTAMQAYRPEPLRWKEISDLRGYLKGNILFPSKTLMTPDERLRTYSALSLLEEIERGDRNQENSR